MLRGDAGAALDQNDPNYDSEDDPCRRAADAEAALSAIRNNDEEGAPGDASTPGELSAGGEDAIGGSSSRIVLAVNKLKEDVRMLYILLPPFVLHPNSKWQGKFPKHNHALLAVYTRIGSNREKPQSTIKQSTQSVHTRSNGTTAPSR